MKLLIVLSICSSTLFAQGGSRQTVESVWKVTEIVIPGAGAYAAPMPSQA